MKALLAACVLLLAGCAAPPTMRAGGGTGERAGGGPTIVSLNPCTDAILAEVADAGQILAISHYSHDPRATSMPLAQARRFRATGGTVEEVLALDPDIVVGSTFMAPATRAAFDRLGIQVETMGIANTVEDSMAQVRRLAELSGHPSRGDALVARIETALARASTDKSPVAAVLWQPDGIVPGESELVSDLMRRTGFSNQTAAHGMGQADYLSLEHLLADPPAVLLVAGDERGQQHPALAALSSTRRATFDPSLLYCGGPTIERAAGRLAEIRRGAA
ncbi:ABC transporter substrate-binding protein [Tsuneonella amylolytica]|uniref:ABC transporter substrate-binding protein n=1 Tax=Tsuneonella amylolytica TaxID=2338327 RepID=UPI001F441E39|nr:ABC transporter substrate-binding protein [Tsuneonella amylolytica]